IGNLHPNIVPYQPFRTTDGRVILACGNDNLYRKFCEVAGCAELADDARFASNGKRVENRAELTRLLQAIFLKKTTREWVELLDAAGVANGPINDVAQVFQEPQVKARGVKIDLEHPLAGKLPLVASPMRFSETPLEHNLAPPVLGQHTEEILREVLKLGEPAIARLRADGIIWERAASSQRTAPLLRRGKNGGAMAAPGNMRSAIVTAAVMIAGSLAWIAGISLSG